MKIEKSKSHVINIVSKNRKKNEFVIEQAHPTGVLYIDGKKIGRTAFKDRFIFHRLNGVIDHYWKIPCKEWGGWDWDDDLDPLDWCECCQDAEYDDEAFAS